MRQRHERNYVGAQHEGSEAMPVKARNIQQEELANGI